ncbi:MAG: flavodoxin-dependent (E)-4-hydroxy-3-methylbut-2-enyl-diphosphate synthase, partial [bacterium]
IQAYRFLAARMDELGMDYPFHLGVTEAGDGEEGRIKSAVGIGSLLEDGIGDTIRVSLTEDPVAEVPVAYQLVEKYNRLRQNSKSPKSQISIVPHSGQKNREYEEQLKLASNCIKVVLNGQTLILPNPFVYSRRETLKCDLVFHKLGSGELPRVELSLSQQILKLDSSLQKVSEIFSQMDNIDQSQENQEYKCETLQITVDSENELSQLHQFKNALLEKGLHVPLAIDFTRVSNSVTDVSKVADRIVFSPKWHSDRNTLSKILYCARLFGKAVEWKIGWNSLGGETKGKRYNQLAAMSEMVKRILEVCEQMDYWNLIFSLSGELNGTSIVRPYRYLVGRLDALRAHFPILIRYRSNQSFETIMLDASAQIGSLLCDGIGDAIHIQAHLPPKDLLRLSYNILQATRLRISKTEFISCPSCGRTLFDLQTTTERIKSKTAHLKGVKIAIMGCIVNGPGEMADADFGYVGAGPKKVNLFVGKECVQRNIPEEVADERLIELIKSHGKWVEP